MRNETRLRRVKAFLGGKASVLQEVSSVRFGWGESQNRQDQGPLRPVETSRRSLSVLTPGIGCSALQDVSKSREGAS